MKFIQRMNQRFVAGLLLGVATQCQALTDPKNLQTPVEPTCIDLKEPLEELEHLGLFKIPWITRFERGPYVSEKADSKGTYYRSPPGGILLSGGYETLKPGNGRTYDGGIYVPTDPAGHITVYLYASIRAAAVEVPATDADCANTGYVKDPATAKISFVALGVGGALGGASGAIIGRNLFKGTMSVGQTALAGAGGGLLAGVFIAYMVNKDVGKIYPGPIITDQRFEESLRGMAAGKVTLRELQPAEGKPSVPAESAR